jgi:hypothetical protein
VFRTGRHVPPSLAMPGTVDHRRVNRAAYRLLVSGWHGRNDENAARLGLLHKRSQPLLFLLPRQVFVTAAPFGLSASMASPWR